MVPVGVRFEQRIGNPGKRFDATDGVLKDVTLSYLEIAATLAIVRS